MTRPPGFSQELADIVLDRIADGEMLTKICQDEDMPTARQFRYWLTVHEHLREPYARARLSWADTWAERVMDISFNPKGGAIDGQGNLILDHATIALLKLQTDNAKWLVGKWAPRTYGEASQMVEAAAGQQVARIERVIIESVAPTVFPDDDPDADQPRQITFRQPEPGDLSQEQWSTLRSLLDMIDRAVGERDASEVFDVLKTALLNHFSDDVGAP